MKPEKNLSKIHSDSISIAKTKFEKYKQKFSDIRKKGIIDCNSINENNMGFAITDVKSKWLKTRYDFTVEYQDLEQRRKELRRDLYEFYKIDYQLKIDTKDELNLFIESDTRYKNLYNICLLVKSIIDYCDSIIDSVEKKSWSLKTMLDWRKFNEGM